MDKDFSEFMKLMDSKDWSKVVDSISTHCEKVDGKTGKSIYANLELTLTVLREYHDWINQP